MSKKSKTDVCFLFLHFGYVESASIPITIYKCSREGHTKFTALRSLANEMYRAFKGEDESGFISECCEESLKKSKIPKFCPDCGKRLKANAIDVESFIDWIRQANESDIDSWSGYGLGYIEDESEDGWSPFVTFDDLIGLKVEQVLEISEKAEQVLAMAVDPAIMSEQDKKAFESFGNGSNRLDFYFGDKLEQGINNNFEIKFLK